MYPIRFHLKTQLFLYRYGFRPHVSDENDQWKRNFLKTMFSRVRVDKRKRNFSKTLRSHHQFHSTPRNIRNLFKMADGRFPFLFFNTYASSMRSRVSYRFQIDSSYTCGRAKTMRKRYEWTRIFWKRRKKVAFSNEYGYVWTGPKTTSDQSHFCFLSLQHSQIFLFTKPET